MMGQYFTDLYRSLEGSFSAGSTATIATKYSFFQVFRDLQNYLAKFSKNCKILQKISDFRKNHRFFFLQKSENFAYICKILRFFANFATFSKNQLDSFVDLEKPEQMRIWLQKFVSIQPRTSPLGRAPGRDGAAENEPRGHDGACALRPARDREGLQLASLAGSPLSWQNMSTFSSSILVVFSCNGTKF